MFTIGSNHYEFNFKRTALYYTFSPKSSLIQLYDINNHRANKNFYGFFLIRLVVLYSLYLDPYY